jgi:hypothetical protein
MWQIARDCDSYSHTYPGDLFSQRGSASRLPASLLVSRSITVSLGVNISRLSLNLVKPSNESVNDLVIAIAPCIARNRKPAAKGHQKPKETFRGQLLLMIRVECAAGVKFDSAMGA